MADESTAVAAFRRVGFTDDQIMRMLAALTAPRTQADSLDVLLEELENRLAGNGMTADVAAGWSVRLTAAWEQSEQPKEAAELVDLIAPHFGARAIDASQAWVYSQRIAALRTAIVGARPEIIDTTARTVPDAAPSAYPESRQPSVTEATAGAF